MSKHFDAIVLGAGAMGSASAYHLARAGQKILLLEQFEFDHQKGSSYGLSRIIRYAYDYPQYVELAKAVYPMWDEFEQEAGQTLYTRTGGIDFGTPDQPGLKAIENCLAGANVPFEKLSSTEASKRFPQFRFDEDMIVLYQADTGILAASDCIRAHLRLAEKHGAVLQSNTPIIEIVPRPNQVTVRTAAETYTAERIIITAGSWAKSVLAELGLILPLTPRRCQEMYFTTTNPAAYEADQFPAFIGHVGAPYPWMTYGIASRQNSGVKVAWHGGQDVNHPSEIDYTPSQQESDDILKFTNRYLPEVMSLKSSRVCLYTMTPDEHWIIDRHPEFPHIVFGGGCSGHSFKFSTIIGKILTQLALQGSTEYDISLFKIERFL